MTLPLSWLLHAPNVHVGGGLVLLKQLLKSIVETEGVLKGATLDIRVHSELEPLVPYTCEVMWVKPRLIHRIQSERWLAQQTKPDNIVFCFHSMPPMWPLAGRVIVFFQNRNDLNVLPLSTFTGKTRLRTAYERWICRTFKRTVDEYWVHTASMARLLTTWHGENPNIRIIPLMNRIPSPGILPAELSSNQWDYIYPADGIEHKNHYKLIEAWGEMTKAGCFPTLLLTLSPHFTELHTLIGSVKLLGARIQNIGPQPYATILALYSRCRSLIFPSFSECFGLPLLEAKEMNLDILAPELDYVRDVCEPAHTFDPMSATSIARAVQRHQQQPPSHITSVVYPESFIQTLLMNKERVS